MRVGLTLPQFRADPEPALAVARAAEDAGLEGVFVFDHLWPIGQPDKPAIQSTALLGALCAETSRVALGTLVARVGLVPDAVLVNMLLTVHRMIGDRLIAGVGTGDGLSKAENDAYGVPYEPAATRLARVDNVVGQLRQRGVTTWIGGRSAQTLELAAGHGVPLNLWSPSDEELTSRRGAVEITWGGSVRSDVDLPKMLGGLADAGVTFAVLAPVDWDWDDAVAAIASAAEGVRR